MSAKRRRSIIFALWIVAAMSDLSVAQAQKLQQVRVALSTPTPHMARLFVAKDTGF